MKHDHKCRVLKMVLATLQNAVVVNEPNKPADASQPAVSTLTAAQVSSAMDVVNSVLKQPDEITANAALDPVEIAGLVLQILQLILSHFPQATPVSAPAAAIESIDATSVLTIIETIMQAIELILSKLPQKAAVAAVRPEALSPVDIAGLVLAVLQLLLSKFGTLAPAPAPVPVPAPSPTPAPASS